MEALFADLNRILLVSLRIGPLFTFAPPFTLVRVPGPIRLILVLAISAALLKLSPAGQLGTGTSSGFAIAAMGELSLGIAMALALQLAFSAIGMAGRALDIQAGFGLAFLIDPTTRTQTPLIGAIFTYAAAAVFFATSGPYDVLAALAVSFEKIPVGTAFASQGIADLLAFLGTVSIISLGIVGLAMLILFLIDIVIAMLSRTLPQMNVLVLGFQVKSIATLFLLPATLALSLAAIARIVRLATEMMVGLA
jgi:flagellar biosynthetic protein FliR